MRWPIAVLGLALLSSCIRIYRWTDWTASDAITRVARRDDAVYSSDRVTPVDVLVIRRDGEVWSGRLAWIGEDGLEVDLGALTHPLPRRFADLGARAQTLDGRVRRMEWAEVDRVVLRRYDAGLSTFVTVTLAVVLGGGAAGGITVALLFATASCPLVSVQQADGTWEVVGEAYGGAIYQALERVDPVPLADPGAGTLAVRLHRLPGEVERIDAVSLWSVEHGVGERALSGPEGRVYVVGEASPARSAVDLAGAEASAWVVTEDAAWWGVPLGPDPLARDTRSGLEVELPAVAAPMLVLTVQTTPVQDLAATALWSALGPAKQARFAAWGLDAGRGPSGRAFREASGLDLRVEAEVGGRWTGVGAIPPVGWRAPRTVGLPLPEGTTRVRLSGATSQWLVDAVAVAPVVDDAPRVVSMGPSDPLLQRSDDERLVLDASRPELTLAWALPAPSPGRARSLFLATEGYYDMMVDEGAQAEPSLVRHVLDNPEELARLGLVAATWGAR